MTGPSFTPPTKPPGGSDYDELIALMVDVKQRRPACVLLQAAYGCNHHLVSSLFDTSTWLLAPTDEMRMVAGTREEWARFAAEANAANPRPRLSRRRTTSSDRGVR